MEMVHTIASCYDLPIEIVSIICVCFCLLIGMIRSIGFWPDLSVASLWPFMYSLDICPDLEKSSVAAIPMYRQYPKSIGAAIPNNRQHPKSIVAAIPTDRQHPKSIVAATPNNRQQPKSIVAATPINRQHPKTTVAAIPKSIVGPNSN